MGPAKLIECRGLRLGYGSHFVASSPDFSVGEGDFVTIAGPNGSGKTTLFKAAAAVVVAVVIVVAMRLVGTLLVSALLVFPAISAMRLARSFRGVALAATLFSVVSSTAGILAAIVAGTPVGATIVVANIALFAVCLVAGRLLS